MERGIETVAELMKIAAITAPKGSGHDFVDVKIASKSEIEKIYEEMMRIAETTTPNFERDAKISRARRDLFSSA